MSAVLHRAFLSFVVLVATFAVPPPCRAQEQDESASIRAVSGDHEVDADRQVDAWSLPAVRVTPLATQLAPPRIAPREPHESARAWVARARSLRSLLRVRMRRARRAGPDDF